MAGFIELSARQWVELLEQQCQRAFAIGLEEFVAQLETGAPVDWLAPGAGFIVTTLGKNPRRLLELAAAESAD